MKQTKKIVKAVQEKLNKKGYSIIDVDGDFGSKTQSAVKLFQTRNVDQNGIILLSDGVLGAITWAVLFGANTVPQNSTIKKKLSEIAIDFANSKLGVL